MDCYILGFLGLSLIGGSLATLTVSKEQHDVLKNTLSDELDKKYESIVNERRSYYLIGLVLGICFSFVITSRMTYRNSFTRAMIFFTVTLGTSVLFYMLVPKSDYMLNYLQTPEEIQAWLKVYNTMKTRYYLGFVLGIIASIPLSQMFCLEN